MTAEEFNHKYSDWLQDRHYGLIIHNEHVVKFLDEVFEDLTKIDGFSYAQIKLKFDMARFYADGVSQALCSAIEDRINILIKRTES